jgi:hypothetical protein
MARADSLGTRSTTGGILWRYDGGNREMSEGIKNIWVTPQMMDLDDNRGLESLPCQ